MYTHTHYIENKTTEEIKHEMRLLLFIFQVHVNKLKEKNDSTKHTNKMVFKFYIFTLTIEIF